MTPHAIVVGAGLTGLGCATELASRLPVTLIDRIPVVGGETGWHSPDIQRLAANAESKGVRMLLGATGLRWEQQRLLLASPGSISWIPGSVLFYAGGIRPATAIDVHVSGDRPAGVIPATVALHLLQSGIRLWSHAVVVGASHWAAETAHAIHGYGGTVTAVVTEGSTPGWADRVVTDASDLRVTGRARVDALHCTVSGSAVAIPCDAVILAGPCRPNRNITGALNQGPRDVVFAQPDDDVAGLDRYDHGRRTAQDWIQNQEGIS